MPIRPRVGSLLLAVSACGAVAPDPAVDAVDAGGAPDAGADVAARAIDAVATCGKCGAVPEVVAQGQNMPWGITLDAVNLYWTMGTLGEGTVMSASLAGGASARVATSTNASALAVRDGNLYWLDGSGSGQVFRVPVAGGPVATLASAQVGPHRIALTEADAYWTNNDGTVNTVPLAGGAVRTLATGQNDPWGIAVDAANVYWASAGYGEIMRLPLAGGVPVAVATGQGIPAGVVVDAENVYWTTSGIGNHQDGRMMSARIAGGAAVTIAADLPNPGDLAVDDDDVYWTNAGPTAGDAHGSVLAAPKRGGAPIALASNLEFPGGIALDACCVYWTNFSGGTVMKVAKPTSSP